MICIFIKHYLQTTVGYCNILICELKFMGIINYNFDGICLYGKSDY